MLNKNFNRYGSLILAIIMIFSQFSTVLAIDLEREGGEPLNQIENELNESKLDENEDKLENIGELETELEEELVLEEKQLKTIEESEDDLEDIVMLNELDDQYENLKWYLENKETDGYHISTAEELKTLGKLVAGDITYSSTDSDLYRNLKLKELKLLEILQDEEISEETPWKDYEVEENISDKDEIDSQDIEDDLGEVLTDEDIVDEIITDELDTQAISNEEDVNFDLISVFSLQETFGILPKLGLAMETMLVDLLDEVDDVENLEEGLQEEMVDVENDEEFIYSDSEEPIVVDNISEREDPVDLEAEIEENLDKIKNINKLNQLENLRKIQELRQELEMNGKLIEGPIDFKGENIIIDNDIDLIGEQWKPIGIGDKGKKIFSGNILGANGGINLYNMHIKKDDYQPGGFIGEIDGGSIKNINFEEVLIDSSNPSANIGVVAGIIKKSDVDNLKISGKISGAGQTAGLAGQVVQSTISNLILDIDVTGKTVAGIVAYMDGTSLENIKLSGKVMGNDNTELIGGMVATGSGKIYHSINEASVSIPSSNTEWTEMGGIIGITQNITMKDVKNTGDVMSLSNMGQNIGGIIGVARNNIKLNDLVNEGRVVGNHFRVGGIVGELNGSKLEYENLINKGDLEGSEKDLAIGGIFGKISAVEVAKFSGFENHGSVVNSGSYNSRAGGLIGWVEHPMGIEISESLNKGSIKSTTGLNTGGLLGHVEKWRNGAGLIIENSSNEGNISGASFAGGLIGGVQVRNISLKNSSNIGEIKASNVGGLIANAADQVSIEESFNKGKIVSSYNGGNIGGLVGNGNSQLTISKSYNEGELVSDGGNIGGLVGQLTTTPGIDNSYNIGKVPNVGEKSGGLFGWIINSAENIEYNFTFNENNLGQKVAGSLGGDSKLEKNYFLAEDDSLKGAMTLDDFKDGKVTYLLSKSGNPWIQGEKHPILSDGDGGLYLINILDGYKNGTIKSPRYITSGKEALLEITAEEGFILSSLSVRNLEDGNLINLNKDLESENRTFIMPSSDVEVEIAFIEADINGEFEIKYFLNGGNFLEANFKDEFKVKSGSFLEEPEVRKERSEFFGWYREETLENKYLFNEAVLEDLNLYASWRPEGLRFVSLDLNYDVEEGIEKIKVVEAEGGVLDKPQDPARASSSEGTEMEYKFKGWYTEAVEGNLWDFSEKVEQDMTLYAQWEEVDPFDKGIDENTAYIIDTIDKLEKLRENVNAGKAYGGKHFKLGLDLDFTGQEWEPIGKLGSPFAGNFNGDNKTISGVQISKNLNDVGLFGRLESNQSTYIKNLKLDNLSITGGSNVGGLVGYVYGDYVFENIEVSGEVDISTSEVGGVVGTLAGNSLTMKSIKSSVNVKNDRDRGVSSGIVGYLQSGNPSLENISNLGRIEGKNLGGLVGRKANVELTIKNSSNQGELISNGGEYVGGLVGIAAGGGSTGQDRGTTIDTSYNSGNIKAISTEYVGGLYGRDIVNESPSLTIRGSYNSGQIISTGRVVGGLVANSDNGSISNSYNEADIESTGRVVGGIGGDMGANIYAVYNTGDITSSSTKVDGVGGLVGIKKANKLEASYNLGKVSGQAEDNVFGTIGSGKNLGSGLFYLADDGEYSDQDEEKSITDFKSGRVVYLMSQARKNTWEQNLSSDEYPVFRTGSTNEVYIFKLSIEGEGKLLDYEEGDNYYNYGDGIRFKAEAKEGWDMIFYELRDWEKGKSYFGGSDFKTIKKIEYSEEDGYYTLKKFRQAGMDLVFAEKGVGTEFDVTFNANGGEFNDGESIKIVKVNTELKDTVDKPEDPIRKPLGKNIYIFKGWYVDEDLTREYEFSSKLVNHLNLYAKWELEIGEAFVEFDLNADEGAVTSLKPEGQVVNIGEIIEKPETPIWESDGKVTHEFRYWSLDEEGKEIWDFSKDRITKDKLDESGRIVLYAQWKLGFIGKEIDIGQGNIHLIVESVNTGNANEGVVFNLIEDIEISQWKDSIGSTMDKRFKGEFNGNGHTIDFKEIDKPLFGFIGEGGLIHSLIITGEARPRTNSFGGIVGDSYGGTVKDITLDNLKVINNGSKNIGGIVGIHEGKGTVVLEGIEIKDTEIDGGNYAVSVGGIVGHLSFKDNSVIKDSRIDKNTTIKSTSNVVNIGGAVGSLDFGEKSDVVLENIITESDIEAPISTKVMAGGIAGASGNGSLDNGAIKSCSNHGNVRGGVVGGIIGFVNSGRQIIDSTNTGQLNGELVGGILGTIDLTNSQFDLIENSVNEGSILGIHNSGGILGSYSGNGSIKINNSKNMGSVTTERGNAGGLVGYLGQDSTIENSWSKADISSATGNAGGLVASYLNPVKADIVKSYSIGNVSGEWAYGIGPAKKIEYSYAIGDVLGKTVATVIGGNSNGAEIKSSYWYGENTTGQYIRPFDSMNPVIDKVYVSLDKPTINGDNELYKSKIAFNSGEVTFLLDGGYGQHENKWTQGEKSPELGSPSYYKVDILDSQNGSLGLHVDEKIAYLADGDTLKLDYNVAEYKNEKYGKQYEYYLVEVIIRNSNGQEVDRILNNTYTITGSSIGLEGVFDIREIGEIKEPKEEDIEDKYEKETDGSKEGNSTGEISENNPPIIISSNGSELGDGGSGIGNSEGSNSGEENGASKGGGEGSYKGEDTTTHTNSTGKLIKGEEFKSDESKDKGVIISRIDSSTHKEEVELIENQTDEISEEDSEDKSDKSEEVDLNKDEPEELEEEDLEEVEETYEEDSISFVSKLIASIRDTSLFVKIIGIFVIGNAIFAIIRFVSMKSRKDNEEK